MEIIKASIRILKNKKRQFSFLFLFISFLFIVNYILEDRVYISDMKLAHNSQDGSKNTSGLSKIVSSFSSSNMSSISSSTTNFDMIPEVISSRDFLNKILEKEFYYDGEMKKLYLIGYKKKLGKELDIPLLKLDARKELSKNISVSKNLNNPVLGISVSSNNQQLSFEIANAVLQQLERDLTNFQLDRIGKKITVINNQIESSSKELGILEEDLRKFRVNNSNILQSPTLRMQESTKLRDILVLSNTYSSLKVELELIKVKYFEEVNVLQVIDAPNLPLRKSSPRLRYMLIKLIFTFSFITLFYIYSVLLRNSDLGKMIKNNILDLEKLD
mgnify:CR=1 FL=1|tara:strand:+ start:799 stop:1788 length:990 start_codon:yes stop_codon:yes gene_type:complete